MAEEVSVIKMWFEDPRVTKMSKDQLLEQSTIQYYETAVNEVLRTKLK